MSQSEATDVIELCAMLKCLGFSVKSIDTSDVNFSKDMGAKTVIINCPTSGLHVVLENPNLTCSCPPGDQQNSGFWQVFGIAGGKQHDKDTGSTILGSLPKAYREHLSKELCDIVTRIKQLNDSEIDAPRSQSVNKSSSMIDMGTPENGLLQIKIDTPGRYRSLDTLTAAAAKGESEPSLPNPGLMQKPFSDLSNDDVEHFQKRASLGMGNRQSTYTVSTPGSSRRRRNRTSSPIQCKNSMIDNLITVEEAARDLHNKIADVIREYMDEGRYDDSSMSSLALDVSKISLLKGVESKTQFASSPNLSGLGSRDDLTKSRMNKRFDSASTSNLEVKKPTPAKEGAMAKFRRLRAPSVLKMRKDSYSPMIKAQESKLSSLIKPKIVTPIRTTKPNSEASPNLSGTKKKYSHIKSTIPRPTPKKD